MKLLLDEHYTPEIARQLRARGHDVLAVKERPGLVSRSDLLLFAAMAAEKRAIATEDVGDFRPLVIEAAARGTDHYGLLCISRRRYPRSRQAIGLLVEALDRFITAHPRVDALAGSERWLP